MQKFFIENPFNVSSSTTTTTTPLNTSFSSQFLNHQDGVHCIKIMIVRLRLEPKTLIVEEGVDSEVVFFIKKFNRFFNNLNHLKAFQV